MRINVWIHQDWCGGEFRLERVKRLLSSESPFEYNVLFGKIIEGLCNHSEAIDKLMVEVGQTKESAM
jgi:hypothetical protein